jgi:ABC-type transport system involved in multi-copper enzyme maturation permease subunit
MTTIAPVTERIHVQSTDTVRSTDRVPLSREIRVELRKMFDTRSGFWLMASIAIAGLGATVAVVAFAPDKDLTYYTFTKAIGFPITVILPIIAVLSITGEWSQRSGLTTFTLIPNRRRVILAKTISSIAVAIASMLFAFVVGAIGNVAGTAIAGTSVSWDMSATHGATILLGNLLCLLTGTMLGMLIRNSPGALVAYFVYALVLPNLTELLATSQSSFRHAQPWVDLNFNQGSLFEGTMTSTKWAQLAVTVAVWLVVPGVLGVRQVMRAEVK